MGQLAGDTESKPAHERSSPNPVERFFRSATKAAGIRARKPLSDILPSKRSNSRRILGAVVCFDDWKKVLMRIPQSLKGRPFVGLDLGKGRSFSAQRAASGPIR